MVRPVKLRWLDVDTAPYDTPIEVRTFGKRRFRARLLKDASMTEDEKPCDQWQAEEGEKYPQDWCGGACWESNSNGIASDPVIGWRAIVEAEYSGYAEVIGDMTVDGGGD